MINSAWRDNSVGFSTVRKWFSKLRVGNFNLQGNPRIRPEKKFEDEEPQALLNGNPYQTQKELGKQYRVKRLQFQIDCMQSKRFTWTENGFLIC